MMEDGGSKAGDVDRCVAAQYHGNEGNTGSFMLRCGAFKYITFGKTVRTFQNYTSQLFDVESDPDELNDLGGKPEHAARIAEMDTRLKSELGVDYQSIDADAVACDCKSYNAFFVTPSKSNATALRRIFEANYHSFDHGDWKKVIDWHEHVCA